MTRKKALEAKARAKAAPQYGTAQRNDAQEWVDQNRTDVPALADAYVEAMELHEKMEAVTFDWKLVDERRKLIAEYEGKGGS